MAPRSRRPRCSARNALAWLRHWPQRGTSTGVSRAQHAQRGCRGAKRCRHGSQRPCVCQPRQITHTLGSARASARRPAPTEGVNTIGSIYWPPCPPAMCTSRRTPSFTSRRRSASARAWRVPPSRPGCTAKWRAAWPSACRSSASRRSAGSTGGPISVAVQPRCVPPIRRRNARRWSPTRRCATGASHNCHHGGRGDAGARRPRRCCCRAASSRRAPTCCGRT